MKVDYVNHFNFSLHLFSPHCFINMLKRQICYVYRSHDIELLQCLLFHREFVNISIEGQKICLVCSG